MLFNSVEFFFFFLFFFCFYWFLFHKKHTTQNVFILLGSYFFYGCWDWRFLSLIILSSCIDFIVGKYLHLQKRNIARKRLLLVSIFFNIGLLGVFKYYDFFISNLVDAFDLFGIELSPLTINIILPIGISFYTFQTLSYTIDIYRRRITPTNDWVAFFAYVAFFPQLVAGPIERAQYLLPQFLKQRKFDYKTAVIGSRQILWGFFKKVAIADNCAPFVDNIFTNYEGLPSFVLVLGAVLFAFQIYCDFSGYSDIAIGTASLLGFRLKQNFSFPYFSRDIAEFWRRWHISLTTWFKDYIYITLGGNRMGRTRTILNITIVFLISGLWHGANWTFIIWGLIHVFYYLVIFYRGVHRKNLKNIEKGQLFSTPRHLVAIVTTFIFTSFAWIFFRAENIDHALSYISHMFLNGIENNNMLDSTLTPTIFYALVMIVIMIVAEWVNRNYKFGLEKMPTLIALRFSIYIILIFLVLDNLHGYKTFIYFQF